jgi:hypothetical protein
MNYTLVDLMGLVLATAGFGVLFVLPGAAIAQLTDAFGFRQERTGRAWVVALLAGYAALPIVDSLLCRFAGLGSALALNGALAVCGLHAVWSKGLPRPGRLAALACGVWLVVLAAAWIDLDTGRGLYPSLLALDIVKHAATVRALVEGGMAPPFDPFFLRQEPAGYYYFYYVLSALVERAGMGWIDSRAAVGGQVLWTGIATVGLIHLVQERAGFKGAGRLCVLLGLMLVAGLQIIPILGTGIAGQLWLGQINWWGEQVTSWPLSMLWVPHHLAALVACWAGFLLLADVAGRDRPARTRRDAVPVVLAGAAFASAAGLSVWLTLGGAVAILLWAAALALERRWQVLLAIAAAGAVSLLAASFHLADLIHYRAYGAAPVALTVRSFFYTDQFFGEGPLRYLARLLALPVNYFLEFGLFFVGAWLFWRRRHGRSRDGNEVARLLTLSAAAGLALATFAKSTIVNNDLAWRVILFAQLAALLWTAAALFGELEAVPLGERLRRASPLVVVSAALGLCGVAYDLVALRAFHPLGLEGEPGMRRDAALDRELRAAYTWLDGNVGPNAVVQHNPDAERALAYGLYGRFRVAISDRHNARLFGAPDAPVARRLGDLIPVFAAPMPVGEARRRLADHFVDIAVATAADPVWRDRASWVWASPALFESRRVRIVPVREKPQAIAERARER